MAHRTGVQTVSQRFSAPLPVRFSLRVYDVLYREGSAAAALAAVPDGDWFCEGCLASQAKGRKGRGGGAKPTLARKAQSGGRLDSVLVSVQQLPMILTCGVCLFWLHV